MAEAPGTPTGEYNKNYVESQEHLLKATTQNPEPTMVPPPCTGQAGAFGDRHVICFVGLPARGKQFSAEKLCRYLRFFHGARPAPLFCVRPTPPPISRDSKESSLSA